MVFVAVETATTTTTTYEKFHEVRLRRVLALYIFSFLGHIGSMMLEDFYNVDLFL